MITAQVAGAEDELVIEHLAPAGADEPFADRVRPRGSEGQLHDFDAFRTEDLIEADGELGVAVSEQEAGLEGAVLKSPGQVPSLLGAYHSVVPIFSLLEVAVLAGIAAAVLMS